VHALDELVGRSAEGLVDRLATLVAADPERHLPRAARIAETVVATEANKRAAARVRRYFEEARDADPQPIAMQTLHRAIDATSPHCRTRLITNLMLWTKNGLPKRHKAQEVVGTSPMVVLISPTMRCNLRCAGCYAAEYDRGHDMPAEVVERIVAEARDLGTYAITLLGGEPFIREDVLDLLDKYRDMTFQVFTNGALITDELAARLANAGNVLVCLSIDGFERDHDARRGEGALRRTEEGMAALRQAGVPFGSSTMVTSRNYMDVTGDAFVDYLIEHGCLWGWHFLYMPVGEDPDISLMPTPQQREYLRTRGAARIRENKPLFVMDFWNDAPYVGGCIAAGREYLHINANGDVEPCIFTHFAADNIRDKSLAEALRSPFFTKVRAGQPYSDNLLRPCMLIDNPDAVRGFVLHAGARPTHPHAEELLTKLAEGLDAYAAEYQGIADEAWAEISS